MVFSIPEVFEKVFFAIFLFILLITSTYILLSKSSSFEKINKSIILLLSISFSFLIMFFILFSPFGKYLVEVVLPFVLLGFFFLAITKVLFPTIGFGLGKGEDGESFITINSYIILWVAIGILLISILATFRKMGYKVVDKLLDPTIFGIVLFFLMVYFTILVFESDKNKKEE